MVKPRHQNSLTTPIQRGRWAHKIEFILSCIGLSVGIGNVWRFPYVAYENGGGTFQIPYLILLIFVGIPLYYMEMIRGQYSQSGPIAVWTSCPAGVGIGWAMIAVSVIGSSYYNVILAYSLLYMASSFASSLPWEKCDSWWGADENCYVRSHTNNTCGSNSAINLTEVICSSNSTRESAPQQFWNKYVLNIGASSGMSNLGNIEWKLAAALAVNWLVVLICVFKGIKSVGKAVYFTAIFPYVILLALLIQGLLLDGASEGVAFFFTPKWDYLLEPKIWLAAAQQMVYSLSVANGALITLASYNAFNNKCNYDTLQVTSLDFITSFLASVVVFSVIGSLAKDLNMEMTSIFAGGQGLAFVVFPEIVSKLPLPQLWCFFFFFMLFMLGIDSTFAVFEAVWAAVFDKLPHLRKHQTEIYCLSIIGFYLLGLIYCTAGGQYVLSLVDGYNTMARTLLVALEVVVVMWVYGVKRFCSDVKEMLGFEPNLYFKICWVVVCPVVVIALTLVSWIQFTPPKYGNYVYPSWAYAIGWVVAMFIILQTPVWAVIVVFRHWKKGDWRTAFQPSALWGTHNNLPPQEQPVDETRF